MDELTKKITERLESLRVHLQADGGDMEYVCVWHFSIGVCR